MLPLDETLAYHAAQMLVLLSTQGGAICGRTLLHLLHRLAKYPHYLARATAIITREPEVTPPATVESRMAKYKAAPWDPLHNAVFGYLIAKGLMQVTLSQGSETFALTPLGQTISDRLGATDAYRDEVTAGRQIARLFADYSGDDLRKFYADNGIWSL